MLKFLKNSSDQKKKIVKKKNTEIFKIFYF
jgi:hypothetical protein